MADNRTRSRTNRRLMLSPLRYPGGKGSLYPRLRELLRVNGLTGGTYVEPYAGGAGAALGLLITGQVNEIIINDLDPAMYAFWRSVTKWPDKFAQLTSDAELNVEEWRRQREVYLSTDRSNHLALGFATFYLNRTNRSGVLNGGPIGGLNQTGNYKIDARFNKSALLERLRLISLYSSRIKTLQRDGLEVIHEYADKDKTFIYADPPYFEKAGTLYMNSFGDKDHAALADCLNSHKFTPWLLTYDNVPQVEQLYTSRRRLTFSLNYSAHRVMTATEIMVLSDALATPVEHLDTTLF